MPKEGILFPSFAFLDLHNHLRINNWLQEGNHHIRKALKDHCTVHGYHLKIQIKTRSQEVIILKNENKLCDKLFVLKIENKLCGKLFVHAELKHSTSWL